MKKILSAVTALSLIASMASSVLPTFTASAKDNGKTVSVGFAPDSSTSYEVSGSTITIPLADAQSGNASFVADLYLDTDVANTFGTYEFTYEASDSNITFSNPVLAETKQDSQVSFDYNGTTVTSEFLPTCFGSFSTLRSGATMFKRASALSNTVNDSCTAQRCDGAQLYSDGNGGLYFDYSYPTLDANGYSVGKDSTGSTILTTERETATISADGTFEYWYYDAELEGDVYHYTKKTTTQTIPGYDASNLPANGGTWAGPCNELVGSSSDALTFGTTNSNDLPLYRVTVNIGKNIQEGTYTVDFTRNVMGDPQNLSYTTSSTPLTIVIGEGGTVATTAAATTAAPEVTTAAPTTTKAATPTSDGVQIKLGEAFTDPSPAYSVMLPVTISNDPGVGGIVGSVVLTDAEKKVFTLDTIETLNEETGITGPFSGTFTYDAEHMSFGIANDKATDWAVQADGTEFMYYYFNVADAATVKAAAEEMGLTVQKDASGKSYYSFPISFSSDATDNQVSDPIKTILASNFVAGAINVYTDATEETTAASGDKVQIKLGEAFTDPSPAYSVMLPVTISNDPGIGGVVGAVALTDEEKTVFTLDTIETLNEETGITGPFSGTFTYDATHMSFGIANDKATDWAVQADGTEFMYYYFNVADAATVKAAAEKMGLTLKTDASGKSYYAFPINFSSEATDNQVSDPIKTILASEFLAGTINVYVDADEETTAASGDKVQIKLGEAFTDPSPEFSVMLPVTISNDPGIGGVVGAVALTDEEKTVFTLDTIETLNEETGITGPFSGTFTYDATHMSFGIANDKATDWAVQADGSEFMYYYFNVADEATVKAAAEKMGLTLKTDASGKSYYSFPISFSSEATDNQVSDPIKTILPSEFLAGAINVYVDAEEETTAAATTVAATTVATTTTTAAATTVAATTAAASGDKVQIKLGEAFTDPSPEFSVMLPVMIYNDPGVGGIVGAVTLTTEEKTVFTLDTIETLNEETGITGPFSGTFTYDAAHMSFGIANDKATDWAVQADGSEFMYYYFNVADAATVKAAATAMGLTLQKDASGKTYYSFPISFSSEASDNQVSDPIKTILPSEFLAGAINVYVDETVEETTAAATTVAATTVATTTTVAATTAAPEVTTAAPTTTVAPVATTTAPALNVTPVATTIKVGESYTISATAADNPVINYNSNPSNVVVIDSTGKVTGVIPGDAKIVVYTEDGRSQVIAVTVITDPDVTTVATTKVTAASLAPMAVNPTSVTVTQGEKAQVAVTGGDGDYTYNVLEPSIAVVAADGTVTGLKPGNVTVIVTDGSGNSTSFTVEVTALTQATTVVTQVTYPAMNVTPKTTTIKVGESYQINATASDNPTFSYTSNPTGYVAVDSTGNVTGIQEGDAKIVVFTPDGRSEVIAVTVIADPAATQAVTTAATKATYEAIKITPDPVSVEVGSTSPITITGGDGNYHVESLDSTVAMPIGNTAVGGKSAGTVTFVVSDDSGNSQSFSVEVTAKSTTTTTTEVTTTTTTTTTEVTTTAADVTIDPSSIPSSDDTSAFFFSVQKNFDKLTNAIKFSDGQKHTVTYQFNGKAVAGPADVWATETSSHAHKYTLDVYADGVKAGTATVYIGVKGDANLDDIVNAKDAVCVLITYANNMAKKSVPLQSNTALESFAKFLADIDTESTDVANLNAKDAVWMLQFYASNMAKQNPTWAKICSALSGKDY